MCWRPPKFWVVKPMVFRVFPSSFQKFPPFSSSRQVWSVSILPTATVMILRPPDPGYFGNPPTDLLMFSMNMYEPSNSLAMLVLKFDSPPWKNDKQWHIQWVFVHDVSTIKLAVWSRSVVCSDNVPRVAKRWRLSAWDFCSPPIIPIIPIIHQTHHPSFSQCQYDSMASLGPANHGTFFLCSCQVYTDESRKEVKCKFYGLRQQLDMGESTYWCQGDFIAPKDWNAGALDTMQRL